jgi:hypothetical protein
MSYTSYGVRYGMNPQATQSSQLGNYPCRLSNFYRWLLHRNRETCNYYY